MEITPTHSTADITPPWLTTPLAIIIAAVMVSSSILYTGGVGTGGLANALKAAQLITPTPESGKPTIIKDPSTLLGTNDPSEGSRSAKVTIVEFSDFQCPFCRQFFLDAYPQIKQQYIDTGKVRFIHRNYPLPFHSGAQPAALASKCAQEQGKFWEYYAKAFAEQQKKESDPKVVTKTVEFGEKELKVWATQIGLNAKQFNSCLDSKKYASEVEADVQAATTAGVTGTPSFFVNGELVVGAQPFSVFKDVIDRALAK